MYSSPIFTPLRVKKDFIKNEISNDYAIYHHLSRKRFEVEHDAFLSNAFLLPNKRQMNVIEPVAITQVAVSLVDQLP